MTIYQINTFKTIRPCFDSRQVTLQNELILVIFVLAGTGREMKHHFPLVINQHYFAWRLRSSVTLWSYRSPLYIMMRTERHLPLLPSPHGSLSLSICAHDTRLARCQPAVPEYSADLLRRLRADDMADLPSSWPVWVTVSFIAVSVAPQMGHLLWHWIFFFFYISST